MKPERVLAVIAVAMFAFAYSRARNSKHVTEPTAVGSVAAAPTFSTSTAIASPTPLLAPLPGAPQIGGTNPPEATPIPNVNYDLNVPEEPKESIKGFVEPNKPEGDNVEIPPSSLDAIPEKKEE